MSFETPEKTFSEKLLAWHRLNARTLPWRGEIDPYKIWISEIMLQQTTTQTVKDYYERFLAAFPSVHALAEADEQSVLKLWEGLGYYSRARNLMKAARIVSREMDGCLPSDFEALKKLPGIGEYTAAAIASMAFDQCEPAMDGNLTRVLARVTAEGGRIDEATVKKRLRAAGYRLIDRQSPGEFNQAMMGLGNLVCVPKQPRCALCPVQIDCLAFQQGLTDSLPNKPPKLDKKAERRGVALVFCSSRVLVRRRPESGLLAGLWEFPHFENAMDAASLIECLEELGLSARGGKKLASTQHVFTHRTWAMTGFFFKADALPDEEALHGVARQALNELPMATAMAPYRELADDYLAALTPK